MKLMSFTDKFVVSLLVHIKKKKPRYSVTLTAMLSNPNILAGY